METPVWLHRAPGDEEKASGPLSLDSEQVMGCRKSKVHAAVFTTAKSGKQLGDPPIEGQINERWHTHTMEYYSAIKRMK